MSHQQPDRDVAYYFTIMVLVMAAVVVLGQMLRGLAPGA